MHPKFENRNHELVQITKSEIYKVTNKLDIRHELEAQKYLLLKPYSPFHSQIQMNPDIQIHT